MNSGKESVMSMLNNKDRRSMLEYEKEIVRAFLKDQMNETRKIIERVESEGAFQRRELEHFFQEQAKREKKILRSLLH
jgi:hypothetical protein